MTTAPTPAAPSPDDDSAPWWQGLREHRIVVQECDACAHRRLPRMPSCPWCASPQWHDVTAVGTGTVYSFVRAHRALTPAMTGEVPYAIAAVDLDGGGRVFARVEPAGDAAIGRNVVARYVDHGSWTELRFVAAAAGARA